MPIANDIERRVGDEIGVSDWITIDQAKIDAFADVTGDHQFIHVDPVAAAATPLGGTIAHGFLTLSLLSQMAETILVHPPGMKMAMNYGFERVRFLAPVRAGKRVRGRARLLSAEQRSPGEWKLVNHITVEIENEDKAALSAEWIGLIFC